MGVKPRGTKIYIATTIVVEVQTPKANELTVGFFARRKRRYTK
jgi:hypothetical protein